LLNGLNFTVVITLSIIFIGTPLPNIKVKLLNYKATNGENRILIDSLTSLTTFLFLPNFANAL